MKKKLFFLFALTMLVVNVARAQEIYAVLSDGGKTMTLFYDEMKAARDNVLDEWNETDGASDADYSGSFAAELADIEKVVLHESMKEAKLTTTKQWFYRMEGLKEIEHLDYLDMGYVTDLTGMFALCTALQSLDLSTIHLRYAEDMTAMFYGCQSLQTIDMCNTILNYVEVMISMFEGCTSLTTIYCNDIWNSSSSNSSNMFFNCTALKGGNGTEYDKNHTDILYARPDREDNKGYFTEKKEIYAALSEDGKTMTLYFDENKANHKTLPFWTVTEGTTGSEKDITKVTKVIVDASMKEARPTSTYRWFYGMENLDKIEHLDYLNTTEVTNMAEMFYHCKNLVTLDLSGFSTDKVTDMNNMFFKCESIVKLDLSNFNTANVTNMAYMFSECNNLFSLNVSNFKTANVTNMAGMFSDCSLLKKLDISSFNTANVTDMSEMFTACASLNSLDLSNFNTDNVTNMTGMFYGCMSLPSLDLSSFNTANVTDMTSMFLMCEELQSLDLSNFNTANVTNMTQMFTDCKALKSLDLSNFNTANVTDMTQMFYKCEKLTSLDLSSFNTANVEIMDGMFSACDALQSLDLSNFNTAKVTDMAGMFAGCTSLQTLDLSRFITFGVSDMEEMFAGCTALTTIYCNDTWTPAYSDDMFLECTSLVGGNGTAYNDAHTNADYARPDEESKPGYFTPVSGIYAALSEDEKTMTLYYDTQKGTRTGVMTEWSSLFGVSAIELPETAQQITAIKKVVFDVSMKEAQPISTYYWFAMFEALEEIEHLDYLNTAQVTDMTYMFAGCAALKTLDLKNFNTANVENMNGMFAACATLQTLDLSSFNTDKVEDMTAMFSGCEALTAIYCNGTWTPDISDDMFLDCNALTGGKGTAYDFAYRDAEYARPDRKGIPGYFTGNFTFQVTLTAENGTITVEEDGINLTAVPDEAVLHLTATPDDGYTFDHWENYDPETGLVVTGDTVITAWFVIKQYTVTFLDKEGNTIGTPQVVEHGADAVAPEAPAVEGYTFKGWDIDYTHVTADLTVTAQYEKKEPTALYETGIQTTDDCRKFIEKGILYIERNGIRYTIQGSIYTIQDHHLN